MLGEVRVQVSGQELNHEEMRYMERDVLKIEMDVGKSTALGTV